MLGVAFSYTKLIPSRVIDDASNRRAASLSRNEDGFTVKESGCVFEADSSEMYSHADTNVLEEILKAISRHLKGALFHLSLVIIMSNSMHL